MKKTLQNFSADNKAFTVYSRQALLFLNLRKLFIVAFCLLLITNISHAQVINEGFEEQVWLSATANPNNSSSTSGSVFISATSANSIMTYYITNSLTSSYSTTVTSTGTGTKSTGTSKSTSTLTSTGLNTSPNSGTWWYSRGNTSSDTKLAKVHSASHSWEIGGGGYLITPVIPAGITTVTCWIAPADNFFIGANTATANVPIMNYNSSSTYNGFTYGQQTFASAGNTSIQSYSYSTFLSNVAQIGFFNKGGNNIYIDDIIINVNPGTQATVATGTNTPPTYTSTIVSGTITANNPAPNAVVITSGVCYSSTATLPDTSNSFTVDGPTGIIAGTMSDTIKGLTPGTHYCARSYAITTAGVVYGSTTTCFTTLSSTAPVITTNPVNVLSSVAANSGGNISDSGGLKIDSSGVCWNTTGNPTVLDNITKDGNSTNYISSMTGLFPCTKYYVRAYAVNSKGLVYGNQLTFTTACVPSLLASPAALNFGLVPIGTSSTLSYTLTGALLTPASGTVTVTAPAGCLISLPGGTPVSTLTLPYNGGSLPPTKINVYFSPTKYGYISDSVTHSGGGAVPPNIQQVQVSGLGSQPAGVYSNVGIDFWTGFGYVEEMSNNKAAMSVYIAAGDQDAVVNVDIPKLGWSYNSNPITVKAHTVYEVTGFPTSTPDSRLYFSGISNRAVHVQSTSGVPVSVWTYTSAPDNTAAGCMNFPTNVWNSQYTVQAFGGFSNQSYPNSYFFVIADEDSTVVTINPTADIVDSSANTIFKDNTAGFVKYPAGTPFSIKLNKGQVFTGISTLAGTGSGIGSGKAFSADLSGTKISTDCQSKKKIAVFGGNARCLVDTSTIPSGTNFQTVTASTGSDNLMQQMFPNSAWGTKYLTVPTKTMEDNYYRIYVQDSTATKVHVNGVLLDTGTLYNKLYYQLSGSNITSGYIQPYDTSGNHFLEIVADQPISVSQFIVAGAFSDNAGSKNGYLYGNNGLGDPEMIILSPIQQSINSVTVATPRFQNNGNGGNYINVVIPKNGVKSFRIYSDTTTASWKQWRIPIDSAYYADTINNPKFDPTNLANAYYSYRNFNDSATQLVDTGASSYISGINYQSSTTFIYLDSAFQPYPSDSNYAFAKFKVSIGNSYTLQSDSGFNAIAYGMDAGESYGFNAGTNLKVINFTPGRPYIGTPPDSLSQYHHSTLMDPSTINTCLSIPFHFTIALSYKPDSMTWNFNVNGQLNQYLSPNQQQLQIAPVFDSTHRFSTDTTLYYFYTLRDPSGNIIKYTFDNLNTYPVTVVTYVKTNSIVNLDPCTVDTTGGKAINTYHFTVDVTKGVHPNFTPKYAVCSSDTVYKFLDSTWDENSSDTSFIVGRIWSFGNGKIDTVNNTNVSTVYTSSGVYPVRLVAIDQIGCIFDTTVNQNIKLNPIANYSLSPDTICAGSSVKFFDHSTTIGKGNLDKITIWTYNYGNGSNTYSDSTTRPWTYNTAGTYGTSLTVTNAEGCKSTFNFKDSVLVEPNPVAAFTIPFPADIARCKMYDSVRFADASTSSNPKYPITQWMWSFGNSTVYLQQAPAVAHYPHDGSYTVTLKVTNSFGCTASTSQIVKAVYNSVAKFGASSKIVCLGIPITYTDSSKTFDPNAGITHWIWDFKGYGTTTNNTTNAAQTQSYDTAKAYTVTLHVINDSGCVSNTDTILINVSPTPVANFIFPDDVCLNTAVAFTNKSTVSDTSVLKYVWLFGDGKYDSLSVNPSHPYSGDGPYDVSLTAYNSTGCSNTITKSVDVIYTLIPLNVGQNYQEGFESHTYNSNPNYFPPVAVGGQRWHVVQSPVDSITWERVVDQKDNIVPSEGHACAWMNNFKYAGNKQLDDLNTPVFGLPQYPGIYDSLYLKFDVSAKTNFSSGGGISDTLEVLMSTDCINWQTIYKKWGAALQTVTDGSQRAAGEFIVNNIAYWRTDSINITSPNTLGGIYSKILQNGGDVRFKFRNHNNKENNVYLDNINLYVTAPYGDGYNTTTIPFDTALTIRYNYPPADLKRLTIYDMGGKLIYIMNYNNNAPQFISLHPGYMGLPYMANGMYVVVMDYTNKKRSVFNFLKQ